MPDHPPVADTQRAGLFIDEVPVRVVRDRAAETRSGEKRKVIYARPEMIKPGEMSWATDGSLYFRWPAGRPPGAGRVIQPPAKPASNDGFNIHGHRVGVRLENVKAFSNGDEGISAHETVEMDVVNAEIVWNGSSAGGVADVGDSVTSYTNCEVQHNLGAVFFFDGKYHRATNCVIHHQDRDIVTRGDATVEKSGVE